MSLPICPSWADRAQLWAATAKGLFQYEPLKRENSIRLLRIPNKTDQNWIACELFEADIESYSIKGGTWYNAASYAWGDPKREWCISVNGNLFLITESAFNVLQAFRATPYLWIDAICIDQANDEEKSQQVQQMDAIYSRANRVLVFLGNTLNNKEIVFSLLERMAKSFQEQGKTDKIKEVEWFLRESSSTLDDPHWEALVELYRKPWFQRIWVIQEAVLGKAVYVCAGYPFTGLALGIGHWALTSGIYRHLKGKGVMPLDATRDPANFESLNLIKIAHGKSLESGKPMILSKLWKRCWSSQAANPKDYMYGLLGLGFKSAIVPDYTKSEADIFRDGVRFCLQQDKDYGVLCLAGVGIPCLNKAILPSWGPRFPVWHQPSVYTATTIADSYSAGGANENLDFDQQHHFEGSKLVVNGALVDRICETTTIFTAGRMTTEPDKLLFDWVRDALILAHESSFFKKEADGSFEKVVRTLVARGTEFIKMTGLGAVADPYTQGYNALRETILSNPHMAKIHDTEFAMKQMLADSSFSQTERQLAKTYLLSVDFAGRFRRFAITQEGDSALVPAFSEVGDRICVLPGSKVPFIIREVQRAKPVETRPEYLLVGEAYVDGVMDGQGLSTASLGDIILV